VRQAAEFAASQLPGGGAVRSVDSASQQVVAGMNYRIELTLADGSRWAVTVYRMLSGQMRLSDRRGWPPPRHRQRVACAFAERVAGAPHWRRVRRHRLRRIPCASPGRAALPSRPQTGTNRECGAGPIDFRNGRTA
jgi:hypothetical protein